MKRKKKVDIKVRCITYGRTIQTRQFESCKMEMTADLPASMAFDEGMRRLEILVKNELDKRFRRFR